MADEAEYIGAARDFYLACLADVAARQLVNELDPGHEVWFSTEHLAALSGYCRRRLETALSEWAGMYRTGRRPMRDR